MECPEKCKNWYTDLNHQTAMDDEVAGWQAGNNEGNLNRFFQDVENVTEDMRSIEQLCMRLQESNKENKTVHNAKNMRELRARMGLYVEQVLEKVKVIKKKLEALDWSRVIPETSQLWGRIVHDRTRVSVVSKLGKKLKDMIDDFQGQRGEMAAEYTETVERRYFTITGKKANEETIENLITTRESESFLQKVIQEKGGVRFWTPYWRFKRHDTVKEIEKNLVELHQAFLDMAALVEVPGHQLNKIKSHVAHVSSFVKQGTE